MYHVLFYFHILHVSSAVVAARLREQNNLEELIIEFGIRETLLTLVIDVIALHIN